MPLAPSDSNPSQWFGPGYSATGSPDNTVAFTIGPSGLASEVTPAEADPNSGDVRKVMWGLVEGLYRNWSVKYGALPTAERPDKVEFTKNLTFGSAGSVTAAYTLRAEVVAQGLDVLPE